MFAIVLVRALRPSKAKNSHCNGTITDEDAANGDWDAVTQKAKEARQTV